MEEALLQGRITSASTIQRGLHATGVRRRVREEVEVGNRQAAETVQGAVRGADARLITGLHMDAALVGRLRSWTLQFVYLRPVVSVLSVGLQVRCSVWWPGSQWQVHTLTTRHM